MFDTIGYAWLKPGMHVRLDALTDEWQHTIRYAHRMAARSPEPLAQATDRSGRRAGRAGDRL